MPQEELQQSLTDLRGEAEKVVNASTRENLETLIGKLESHLDESTEDQTDSVTGALKGLIEQYEVEHPKVTNILNRMMLSLSSMGI